MGAKNEGPKSEQASAAAARETQAKSALSSIFSLSTLSSLMAAFYIYFAFSNLVNLMYPLRNIPQDVLNSYGNDRTVFPFWNWDEKSAGGRAELGLRVYLSTQEHFSVNFFQRNDKFEARTDGEGEEGDGKINDDGINTVYDGNSFLLWSEDNTFESTKSFHSRSFVIVASDNSCETGTCSNEQHQSIEFANQWIKDSIKHEKQLQSDGGGLISAMNSAGGGIESTSVLLALYSSFRSNIKHLFEYFTSGGDVLSTKDSKTTHADEEEPKSIIYISPHNPIWKSLMSNGTAYVHVLLVRQKPSPSSGQHLLSASPNAHAASQRLQQLHSQHNVLFGRVGMTKRELPLHVPSPKRLLYKDILFAVQKYGVCTVCKVGIINSDKLCGSCCIGADGKCSTMVPPWNVAHHQPKESKEYTLARQHKQQGVKYPYWKPEVHIHLIQEEEGYPIDFANHLGFEIVQVGRSGSKQHASGYAYLPAVHVDEIGLTSDKYIPLNETVSALPLRVGFHSGMDIAEDGDVQHQQGLTPARYRLLNHLSSSLESQAELGFEQSDIDDLRRLIAETNVMLLAITILASVLHLLFEFLTFKSDVQFWNSNTDLTGLSVRALFLDWMSQVIILLYLIEMDSSLLMTVPTGVGMLIALWKCQRGAGFKFIKSTDSRSSWYNKFFRLFGYELSATRLKASSNNNDSKDSKKDLAALTEEMDQLATNLLGKYFLIPLVVSYAVYSLIKEYHAGWYSWFITTASSFVYAIGFVLMTPQLFLNYKLKSVAHLPWRVLGYKFVNTFIDDLFAFIIRMPTMARMSCFRDDVVFIIYLWQRYLYPVDTSRPVEGGGVVEVQSNKDEKKGKAKQS